ncbi:RING-type domain-containing protein [Psidium guajava]|nr:RING-type domain-containing protein [Psidium guajava]
MQSRPSLSLPIIDLPFTAFDLRSDQAPTSTSAFWSAKDSTAPTALFLVVSPPFQSGPTPTPGLNPPFPPKKWNFLLDITGRKSVVGQCTRFSGITVDKLREY